MKIGFILFDNVGGKKDAASSRLRGRNLMKYWPEAEEFVQGENYDVVIFQKVYQYEMAKQFKCIKILDICDPDWMDGARIVEFIGYMDAITVPTKEMKDYLDQLTDKPVVIIPDRQDLKFNDKIKVHKGIAKKVVWFGYSGNSTILKGTEFILKKCNLDLTVISDLRRPYPYADKNIKWKLETVNDEILRNDIVLMPQSTKGRFKYKSNNKTTKSWALGMPVANTPEDIVRFLSAKERQRESEIRLKEVKEKWDVRLSVRELKDLIKKLKNKG